MLPDTYDKDSFDGIPLTVLEHFDWEEEPETEHRLASDVEEGLLCVCVECDVLQKLCGMLLPGSTCQRDLVIYSAFFCRCSLILSL